MTYQEFSKSLQDVAKSEQQLLEEFIIKEDTVPASTTAISSVEAKAKDLKLDQVVEIAQELSNGTIKRFKFKIIEIWPTPTNFFTVISLEKPKDELNFWTLFYDNTWYIKKSNKSLINVHVRLT